MKSIYEKYEPPEVSGYPAKQRGLDVQCPASRRNPESGVVRPHKDDPMISRDFCASSHFDVCNRCVNRKFKLVMEHVGDNTDWIDDVVRSFCKVSHAEVEKFTKGPGDCCLKHHDVLLYKYRITAKNVMDREIGKELYSALERKASRKGVELTHVKIDKYSDSFDLSIAVPK
jgi:hypothetical protein